MASMHKRRSEAVGFMFNYIESRKERNTELRLHEGIGPTGYVLKFCQ